MLNKEWTYSQEKIWLDRVAAYGCVITRIDNGIQLHHPVGRKARQNKLFIGQRFVYPLAYDLHDIYGKDPLNVTNHKKLFIAEYGKESDNFHRMCMDILEQDGQLPFPDEELQAIMDTNA